MWYSEVLPEDILLGLKSELLDAQTAEEYLADTKTKLTDIIHDVRKHLLVSQQKMIKTYDKNVGCQPHSYQVGDQVWLKKKCYKTDENTKLSPRRTGPWSIIKKLPNKVNFKIKCGSQL